jgi:hypothetical protein
MDEQEKVEVPVQRARYGVVPVADPEDGGVCDGSWLDRVLGDLAAGAAVTANNTGTPFGPMVLSLESIQEAMRKVDDPIHFKYKDWKTVEDTYLPAGFFAMTSDACDYISIFDPNQNCVLKVPKFSVHFEFKGFPAE